MFSRHTFVKRIPFCRQYFVQTRQYGLRQTKQFRLNSNEILKNNFLNNLKQSFERRITNTSKYDYKIIVKHCTSYEKEIIKKRAKILCHTFGAIGWILSLKMIKDTEYKENVYYRTYGICYHKMNIGDKVANQIIGISCGYIFGGCLSVIFPLLPIISSFVVILGFGNLLTN